MAQYDCLLLDLDDTLYPKNSGLARECGKNIKDYMVEKLGIEKDKVVEVSNILYKNYGTTMAGLRAIGYDFDYDDFHRYVHGRLPYENLKPDPSLRSLLQTLPLRKIIFTNADKVHAAKALTKLGLEDCFEGILCFETLNPTHKNTVSGDEKDIEFLGSAATTTYVHASPQIFDMMDQFAHHNQGATLPKTPIVCKPQESAIGRALNIAKINPQKTLFFDDNVRNIQAGKHIGTSQRPKGADYALESIHNIKQALPELWEIGMKSVVSYPGQVTVEKSVTA
ncbi:HAD-superfamily hydrolase, subfamily IA, variant 3 [Gossypium australe]|uniref:HAD-superfamily hydrolase, subfamily IA, variant 3 n=1 Tax=Gossypium australe TaxID=47621 RepID=A0A5B6X079_9ROSI|nr:HAD-superfamily hydrolase, subfamily IA, variant 3 [Gossypium australe]KAA3487599.1 HAD-superfamily hydrolase, subfamily IA, variant 3 [Gossypium australe]